MPTKASHKKNGWKDIQSQNKSKKRTKLALAVLALVLLLIISSGLIRFTKSFFSPWSNPTNYHRSYLWHGQFNINVLVRSKTISILSYNPIAQKLTMMNIPDQTYLEVPFGFGKWQLRAVYGLGGDQLLKQTMTDFLAAPIDGFLAFDASSPIDASQFVDTIRDGPLGGANLLSSLKTDLTPWELIRLKISIASLRFDKIKKINLESSGILDEEKLADGSTVFSADPVKLDSILSFFTEDKVIEEHQSIAVFNATSKAQLAQKWARLIKNIGGNVIITANSQRKFNQTQVIGEKSKTWLRLSQIFALDCSNNPKCDKIAPGDNDLASRAQINLFLGEDYLNY